MANLVRLIPETVIISEKTLGRGIRYVKVIQETVQIIERTLARGIRYVKRKSDTVVIVEKLIVKGARKFLSRPETVSIRENIRTTLKQGDWTDPTYYQLNDVPTTSGSERLNINAKVLDRLSQLHHYVHGELTHDFHFKNAAGTDFIVELTNNQRGVRLINSAGSTVFRINDSGEIETGIINGVTVESQFAGVQTVVNKVGNVRIPFPGNATLTTIVMTCDDAAPPTSSALTYRVNINGSSIGTVSIAAGQAFATASITASCLNNDIVTFDCTAIGAGVAGRDVHIQLRGYRTSRVTQL